MHGVTEVKGIKPRITAILTYDEEPVQAIDDGINVRIYGKRVENILANRALAQIQILNRKATVSM